MKREENGGKGDHARGAGQEFHKPGEEREVYQAEREQGDTEGQGIEAEQRKERAVPEGTKRSGGIGPVEQVVQQQFADRAGPGPIKIHHVVAVEVDTDALRGEEEIVRHNKQGGERGQDIAALPVRQHVACPRRQQHPPGWLPKPRWRGEGPRSCRR